MKLPLSVAVVCKNEEDRIEACLASAAFADEIVVVDSGSADRTLELARRFTDRILFREWKGWRDQKQWAAAQCRNEWVLTLDADETIGPELAAEISAALSRPSIPENGFTLPRRTFYQGRWIQHAGWYPDRKLRLYRQSLARFGGDDPHEVIEVPPPVGAFSGDLFHYTYRDLHHQAAQLARYAHVNAQARHDRGARFHLLDLLFRPPFAFLKSYLLQQGFRDGMPGFIIGVMVGYYTFLKYARLWEMEKGR
jgi:glycosyltransferase involved in cell wall biosynthesis